jgi:hypothetical protein
MKEAHFAKAIGETAQTVHNWKVRGNIPSQKLKKVSKVIGISVDELLTHEAIVGTQKAAEQIDGLPDELINAWKQMDRTMRAHFLAIAEALAAKK